MTCSSCSSTVEKFGATPANIQWSVVRGDTAKLRIEFCQNNETSEYDTDGWVYEATVYNPITDLTESLSVLSGEGYVDITASANLTENWGTGYSNIVEELPFDSRMEIVPQDLHKGFIRVSRSIFFAFLKICENALSFSKFSLKNIVLVESILQRMSLFFEID
jgi:hypothetical protein